MHNNTTMEGERCKAKDHNRKVQSSHNHPPTTQTKLVSEIKWFLLRARVGHGTGTSCEQEIKGLVAVVGGIHGGPGFARRARITKKAFDLKSQLPLRIPRRRANARAHKETTAETTKNQQKCRLRTTWASEESAGCAQPGPLKPVPPSHNLGL